MANMADIKTRRAATFARLEACAAAGERCPTRDDGLNAEDVSALAKAGHNWRRVTIMEGAQRGRSTAPNPKAKASVYMTIDKSGTRINGKLVDSGGAARQQPSKPQLMPYVGKA